MSVASNVYPVLLGLARQGLADLANPAISLSTVIRAAIRIARLRNDYINVWWLEFEMLDHEDHRAKQRLSNEMALSVGRERFDFFRTQVVEDYISERSARKNPIDTTSESGVFYKSVPQIERLAAQLEQECDRLRLQAPPMAGYRGNVDPSIEATELQFYLFQKQEILERVRHRVHSYLASVEQQLMFAEINANIFSRYQSYVDTRLALIAPGILEQLNLAYEQANKGTPEAYSHAALSCRRALKSLADLVYPPRIEPVIGADGKERKLTDDLYIARLWQFLSEQLRSSTTGKVMIHTLDALGSRIDAVYALASKGVHADIPVAELDQCVIQTYLLISDVLRVHEQSSQPSI